MTGQLQQQRDDIDIRPETVINGDRPASDRASLEATAATRHRQGISTANYQGIARQLRTPTVAADVGGMPQLAYRALSTGDVDDLRRAIEVELENALAPATPLPEDDQAVHFHLRPYGEPT
jgi:hypothetical protein